MAKVLNLYEAKTQLSKLVDEAGGFETLPITFAHAAEVGRLPPRHADSFDRMLVAQARLERLILVTHDEQITAYDVEVLLV